MLLGYNKAERSFGVLVGAAKPSETRLVFRSGHPSKYICSPLPLQFSEQTDTHQAVPQFMKTRNKNKKQKKSDL